MNATDRDKTDTPVRVLSPDGYPRDMTLYEFLQMQDEINDEVRRIVAALVSGELEKEVFETLVGHADVKEPQ